MTKTKNILEDISAPSLVKAVEDNQFEYLMDLGRSPQVMTIHEGPELIWFLTGVPFPGFNRIVRARFEATDMDAKIEAALAPFKSHDVPMLWHIGPSTQPANLGERLLAHGLTHTAEESGMATDLSTLESNQPLPLGLRIEHVQDTERLKIWDQIIARAFDFPGELGDAIFRIEASLAAYAARHLYLGSVEGEPVATALLFLGAGVAGIYGVGTIPEARRQGIGRAMTVAPLLEAREMGYRIGVLHASPMGEEIYRRLGFQEYCKLGRYVWRKPGAWE
jgi:ribosomal protein S18 acetylase RimI-like enzyme